MQCKEMASWPLFATDADAPTKGFVYVTYPGLEECPKIARHDSILYVRVGIQSWNDEEDYLSCKFIAGQCQRVFRGIQPWLGCPLAWQVLQYTSPHLGRFNIASEFLDVLVLFQTGASHLVSAGELLHVLPTSKGRLRMLCFPVADASSSNGPTLLGIATPHRVITLSSVLFIEHTTSARATFELEGKLPVTPPKDGYRIVGIPIAIEIHIY